MGTTTSLRLAELHATCPGKASTSGTSIVSLDSHAAAQTPFLTEQPRACQQALEMGPRPSCLDSCIDEVKAQPNANWRADIIADAAFAKFAHPDVSSSNNADNMGASASRRDARGIVMSMGRDSAMSSKVRLPNSVKQVISAGIKPKRATPPPARCGLPQSGPFDRRGTWRLWSAHRPPTHDVLSTRDTKPQSGADSNIPSSASNRSPRVASVKEDRCRIRRNVADRHVSIPRLGESGTQRLGRIESPAPHASPMGWDRHQCGVLGRGARHRLPIHMPRVLTMFGKPPILHAMNYGFRGLVEA